MSSTFNRSEILKAAHFYASWRKASGMKGTYREIFARELAAQWKRAKAARARFEQKTGLPLRSCPSRCAGAPDLFHPLQRQRAPHGRRVRSAKAAPLLSGKTREVEMMEDPTRRALMAGLASLPVAAVMPAAPCDGLPKISSGLAAAFRRFEEACAEFSATCDARESDCVLAQLGRAETDAVIDFAIAHCVSEAEFVFKLKRLRDYERGTFSDRDFNYLEEDGSLLLAMDSFFQPLVP